jgi:hypothetical protein
MNTIMLFVPSLSLPDVADALSDMPDVPAKSGRSYVFSNLKYMHTGC